MIKPIPVDKNTGLPLDSQETSKPELSINQQETADLLTELNRKENELRLAQEKFEAEKLAFELEKLNQPVVIAPIAAAEPLVENDYIAGVTPLPTRVRLKMSHTFQSGMPSRPDILVTHNFKQDQVVNDRELIQLLIDTGSPISVIS